MFRKIQFFILAAVIELVNSKDYTLPYSPLSHQGCLDSTNEFLNKELNLCCSKCVPGNRLKTMCSASSDTVCEECPNGTYNEKWSFFDKCFRCTQCKPIDGLRYAQTCNRSTNARCECMDGWFCFLYHSESCKSCSRIQKCEPGLGVSIAGNSRPKCEPCRDGTFSNQHSSNSCQPHTNCESLGLSVLHHGNATSDTVCKQPNLLTTVPPCTTTIQLPQAKPSPPTRASPTLPPWASISDTTISHPSKSVSSVISGEPSAYMVMKTVGFAVGGVAVGAILLLVIFIICRKRADPNNIDDEKATMSPHGACMGHQNNSTSSRLEQQHLLGDGGHKDPSLSSTSSQAESNHSGWVDTASTSTPEGLRTDSPQVNVSITTTINYKLHTNVPSCPAPASHESNCSPDSDIPLSKEEMHLPPYCEARVAVQEIGKGFC